MYGIRFLVFITITDLESLINTPEICLLVVVPLKCFIDQTILSLEGLGIDLMTIDVFLLTI